MSIPNPVLTDTPPPYEPLTPKWRVHEFHGTSVYVRGVCNDKVSALLAIQEFTDRLFPYKLQRWMQRKDDKSESFRVPQIKTTLTVCGIVHI